jgi:Tol biopolymer transport system component
MLRLCLGVLLALAICPPAGAANTRKVTDGTVSTHARDISDDGRFLLLWSEGGQTSVWDRSTGSLVHIGNSVSWSSGAMNSTGRFVAFASPEAIDPKDTNASVDVYVLDRVKLSYSRASVGLNVPNGLNPSISADGRFVAFQSEVAIFVRDLQTRTTERPNINRTWRSIEPIISGNGRFVVFAEERTGVFIYDRQLKKVIDGPVKYQGRRLFGLQSAVSHDGRYVLINASLVNEPSHAYLYDAKTKTTTLISGQPSVAYSISPDGRFIGFVAKVLNHDYYAETIFLRDRKARTTEKISIELRFPENASGGFVSANGQFVAFHVDPDPEDEDDISVVYLRNRGPQ